MFNRSLKFFYALLVVGLYAQAGFAAPKEVRLKAAQKEQLMAFLQDIVAAPVSYFQNGKISNSDLIDFGLAQNWLRRPSRIKLFRVKQDDYYVSMSHIAANHVAASVQWTFGKTIKHQSIQGWQYRNKNYVGGPEQFEQLQTTPIQKLKLFDLGKGLFSATFAADMELMDDSTKLTKNQATLKKVGSGKAARFILIGYTKAR